MNPKTKLLCVSWYGFVKFSNQILDSLYDFDITYYKTFVPVRYQWAYLFLSRRRDRLGGFVTFFLAESARADPAYAASRRRSRTGYNRLLKIKDGVRWKVCALSKMFFLYIFMTVVLIIKLFNTYNNKYINSNFAKYFEIVESLFYL